MLAANRETEQTLRRNGEVRSARDNASILSQALDHSYGARFWMVAIDDGYRFVDHDGMTIEAMHGTYVCAASPLDTFTQDEYFGSVIGVLLWVAGHRLS